jgi:hypothetical protein
MALFWHTDQSYDARVDQLPPPVDQQAIEAPAVPELFGPVPEVVGVVPARPGGLWPSVQPDLERAIVRAMITAFAVPATGDLAALEQASLKAIEAAAAVARDATVDGSYRASAVADGRRVVEVLAQTHERAQARRERWLDGLIRVLAALVGAAMIGRSLRPAGVR